MWNIDLLTAGGPTVNAIILLSVPAVFLAGAGYAIWMRRNRPDAYARIATTNVDAEELEAADAPSANVPDAERA